MGSFRPAAGTQHLHWDYNFTELLVETAPRSLHDSCRSELARIRAGRNLPDKEFRYLRTVIVTADIHGGFGSELRLAADPLP